MHVDRAHCHSPCFKESEIREKQQPGRPAEDQAGQCLEGQVKDLQWLQLGNLWHGGEKLQPEGLKGDEGTDMETVRIDN